MTGKNARGFVMTAEAAFSMLLLAAAASSLALFSFPQHDSQAFYLCSDATVILVKSQAFASQAALEGSLAKLGSLSSLCISAAAGSASAESCGQDEWGGETFSFSVPVFNGEKTVDATVRCSRPARHDRPH